MNCFIKTGQTITYSDHPREPRHPNYYAIPLASELPLWIEVIFAFRTKFCRLFEVRARWIFHTRSNRIVALSTSLE